MIRASVVCALSGCNGKDDHGTRANVSPATIMLNRIGKSARRTYVETSAFPKGTSAELPTKPAGAGGGCCAAPDHKCPVTNDWAADPVWSALDISLDEPSEYRFEYESADGTSFKATAVGDLDCDGTEATYVLEGRVDGAGEPALHITAPPAGAR
jgi:hypothetical protein